MEPSFDAWSLLFLITSGQGLFLSVLLFARKSHTNNLLAWLVLSFSLCMGYYVVFWTGYYQAISWKFGVFQGLTFLFGPLALSYLQSDKKTTRFDARHLIPLCIYVLVYLADTPPRFFPGYWLAVAQVIHLMIYSALIFRWLSKNKGHTNGALKRYQWHRKVAFAFTGYAASFLLYYVLVWTGMLRIEYDYMISLASSIFIYFIGYYGFQRQEVLRMNEDARYDKSTLNETAARSILEQLKRFMETEKPYLESSLKLKDVANHLGLQSHHISQVINELEEKNFSDFINEYRVSQAIRLLKVTDQKIMHVAFDSGFNNKASFNNAFRKVAGMSPSQYREAHRSLIKKG
ncbi:MAG: helix-turn-helix domain-containing protein [Ekhidna sp.]